MKPAPPAMKNRSATKRQTLLQGRWSVQPRSAGRGLLPGHVHERPFGAVLPRGVVLDPLLKPPLTVRQHVELVPRAEVLAGGQHEGELPRKLAVKGGHDLVV